MLIIMRYLKISYHKLTYPVAPVASTCEWALSVSSIFLSEYRLTGELYCLWTRAGCAWLANGLAALLWPLPIGALVCTNGQWHHHPTSITQTLTSGDLANDVLVYSCWLALLCDAPLASPTGVTDGLQVFIGPLHTQTSIIISVIDHKCTVIMCSKNTFPDTAPRSFPHRWLHLEHLCDVTCRTLCHLFSVECPPLEHQSDLTNFRAQPVNSKYCYASIILWH